MAARPLVLVLVGVGVLAQACSRVGDVDSAVDTPAGDPQGAAASAQGEGAAQADTARETLVREIFSYAGAGRDPFISLLQSGDVRPLVQDLRVTSIAYDTRYPGNSVAVLRDTTANKAYPVHVGDELGRLRVVEIRPGEVVLVVEDFGSEREVIIQQRRRTGETQ